MKAFHDFVRDARLDLGFKTAKDFFRVKYSYLSMSYESYSNIEAGRGMPSADKLAQLIDTLEIKDIRGFALSYCYSLMPDSFLKKVFEGLSLSAEDSKPPGNHVSTEGYASYKEKFHALLEYNRLQAKYEMNEAQLKVLEKDLICWDIVNLYISLGDEGLSLSEIASKTKSSEKETEDRLNALIDVGMIKKLENGNYLVTQYAFFTPRKPIGDKLTHGIIRRELENTYDEPRNHPYARFRFLSLKPEARDKIEELIDSFILDCRQFKNAEGSTHYIQILFSDRNDL